jgi:hypothetical protein
LGYFKEWGKVGGWKGLWFVGGYGWRGEFELEARWMGFLKWKFRYDCPVFCDEKG